MAFQFLDYTLRRLNPGLYVFDGIVPMYMLKLVVEDLDLGLHLFQSRIVYQIDLLPAVNTVGLIPGGGIVEREIPYVLLLAPHSCS